MARIDSPTIRAATTCKDIDARLWTLNTRHLRAEVRDGSIVFNLAHVALNRAREFCTWPGANVGKDSARAALDGDRRKMSVVA